MPGSRTPSTRHKLEMRRQNICQAESSFINRCLPSWGRSWMRVQQTQADRQCDDTSILVKHLP